MTRHGVHQYDLIMTPYGGHNEGHMDTHMRVYPDPLWVGTCRVSSGVSTHLVPHPLYPRLSGYRGLHPSGPPSGGPLRGYPHRRVRMTLHMGPYGVPGPLSTLSEGLPKHSYIAKCAIMRIMRSLWHHEHIGYIACLGGHLGVLGRVLLEVLGGGTRPARADCLCLASRSSREVLRDHPI